MFTTISSYKVLIINSLDNKSLKITLQKNFKKKHNFQKNILKIENNGVN